MSNTAPVEPLALAQALIRRPSVTPAEAGVLDVLGAALEGIGFRCTRLPFSRPGTDDVDNLYARIGTGRPHFCFAGHTDVVPVGDAGGWQLDPFGGEVRDGLLHGRGAADMKSAIAAFAAAADRFLRETGAGFEGSISLLITGDEEGPAVNGTVRMLDWLETNGVRIDHCLVGEPTNPAELGEMVKIGRRGTLNTRLTVLGSQGHVAYPQRADNPIPRLLRTLDALLARRLDQGNAHFQPSNLEVTTIDVGNPATNVIPARAAARFNIRFNTEHTGESLAAWIRETCAARAGAHEAEISVGGEPFLTEPGPFTDMVAAAIEAETGRRPELSTTGGTSDARFIARHCPVCEFGLVGATMHKVNECVPVADIERLARIYARLLRRYFARSNAAA